MNRNIAGLAFVLIGLFIGIGPGHCQSEMGAGMPVFIDVPASIVAGGSITGSVKVSDGLGGFIADATINIDTGGVCTAAGAAVNGTVTLDLTPLNPGWIGLVTITAKDPDTRMARTQNVYVVGVSKIQYKGLDGNFTDMPGAGLLVPVGQSVTYQAVQEPADAPWPAGQPSWKLQTNGAGTGSPIGIAVTQISATGTTKQAIEADVGSTSATAGLIGYDLTIATEPIVTFLGRSNSNFGVGETFVVTATITPDDLSITNVLGTLRWSATPNSVTFTINPNDTTTGSGWSGYLPCAYALTATSSTGSGFGKQWSAKGNVVAPAAYYAELDPDKPAQIVGPPGVALTAYFLMWLTPSDVSFASCRVQETDVATDGPQNPPGWGSMSVFQGFYHVSGTTAPDLNPTPVRASAPTSIAYGSRLNGGDVVGFGLTADLLTGIGHCWYNIPVSYAVYDDTLQEWGTYTLMTQVTQDMQVTTYNPPANGNPATCTAQVSKFGLTVAKGTN